MSHERLVRLLDSCPTESLLQRLHMTENISTEFVPGLHNRKEFKYSKILKVKDMLLYLDRILYAFNNNHEVTGEKLSDKFSNPL